LVLIYVAQKGASLAKDQAAAAAFFESELKAIKAAQFESLFTWQFHWFSFETSGS
jgi:hypothetical protein